MTKDYIYIKFCNNWGLNNIKIKLKNKCNKIVFDGMANYFGKVKIPVHNNEVYKLIVNYNSLIKVIPLIARKGNVYCISINENKKEKHLVTILLTDKNYPNIKIEGGMMTLWQDTQSQ